MIIHLNCHAHLTARKGLSDYFSTRASNKQRNGAVIQSNGFRNLKNYVLLEVTHSTPTIFLSSFEQLENHSWRDLGGMPLTVPPLWHRRCFTYVIPICTMTVSYRTKAIHCSTVIIIIIVINIITIAVQSLVVSSSSFYPRSQETLRGVAIEVVGDGLYHSSPFYNLLPHWQYINCAGRGCITDKS